MTSPDQPRRAPRLWVWAVVLVVLAVAVPVAVLVVHDPSTGDRGPTATPVAGAPSAEPGATEEPADPPPQTAAPDVEAGVEAERGPVRALFFGDSYFIGGGYTSEDNSMARLASNRLGWDSEINGGGGTGFVQTNWDYGLGNYLDQIGAGAFDVGARRWVVIEGGNNDVYLPAGDIRANARRVVRKAQRTFPDAKVVLVGPLDQDADHTELLPIIKTLRKVASKRGVPFVNMKNWLDGHYDLIGPDYVHPYPEGHRILGRKLAKALRGLGA
ncbi:SGNH/GDSL hydrolase family protein [Nocardioides sp.]|uniref:SGNH/GDSL hydrolase family protein n=1 Tax=Nocardioides sp. TaxID=35761 RepID=UPI001A33CA7B|nr:SGNH/GDSL hydrolase family protein [Nocardioides sp.]MBJ7358942.1 SGNH/GDSL hydrolase family protein [Nocardioides sp.]